MVGTTNTNTKTKTKTVPARVRTLRARKRGERTRRRSKCVHENTYRKWEEKLRKLYSGCLLPRPGRPVLMHQNKVIVAVDFLNSSGVAMHSRVANGGGGNSDLPLKHTIMMYHIGREKMDGVRLGRELREGQNVFKHPALDFGGLTNAIQKVGQRLDFCDDTERPIQLNARSNAHKICQSMYTRWLKYSNKSRFADEPTSAKRGHAKAPHRPGCS